MLRPHRGQGVASRASRELPPMRGGLAGAPLFADFARHMDDMHRRMDAMVDESNAMMASMLSQMSGIASRRGAGQERWRRGRELEAGCWCGCDGRWCRSWSRWVCKLQRQGLSVAALAGQMMMCALASSALRHAQGTLFLLIVV